MAPKQNRHQRGFEYSPLQTNSFRVLELVPGKSPRADIHCRLRHYHLDTAPPYEALSYTWGNEESKCRILLDGLPFYIRPNLRDALRRLRHSQSTRIIWIDAICINQNNTDEKNAQVALMGNIYARVERVIAWLGEETTDSGKAVDFMPHLTAVAKINNEYIWLSQLKDEEFLQGVRSLFYLFSRDWWNRVWIIQEVVLARDVVVLCGSRETLWSMFHPFIMAWMNIGNLPYNRLNECQRIALRGLSMLVAGFSEALARLRQSHQTVSSAPASLDLSNLLWPFRYRLATNPRDKIYGLLGLLSGHGVQVDYDKSAEDIYISFFYSCLVEDKGLDWFRWMTGEHCESKELCLPSWVPDFGPRSLLPISSVLSNQEKRAFSTAIADDSRSLSAIRPGDDLLTLILRGHLFDAVSQCGRIYPHLDDMILAGSATGPVLSHWKEMAMHTRFEKYHSHIAKEDAFWRTILTDRQIGGFHLKKNAGWDQVKRLPAGIQNISPKDANEEHYLLQAIENRQLRLNGRRFGITRKGHFCLLPPTASEGDLICVLLGGEVPYVLRRIKDQGEDFYTMVGECYVHGIMDGEAVIEGKDKTEFRLR